MTARLSLLTQNLSVSLVLTPAKKVCVSGGKDSGKRNLSAYSKKKKMKQALERGRVREDFCSAEI